MVFQQSVELEIEFNGVATVWLMSNSGREHAEYEYFSRIENRIQDSHTYRHSTKHITVTYSKYLFIYQNLVHKRINKKLFRQRLMPCLNYTRILVKQRVFTSSLSLQFSDKSERELRVLRYWTKILVQFEQGIIAKVIQDSLISSSEY